MRYSETLPPPSLRRAVACFWSVEDDGEDLPSDAGTVVPDGCVEIVVSRRDPVTAPDGRRLHRFVVGQQLARCKFSYPSEVHLEGVRLRASAAYALFGLEVADLVGRVESLAVLSRSLDRELESSHPSTLAFEGFTDPLADAAVGLIESSGGRRSISSLMAELGVSGRALERCFDRAVGLSPKLLSRIVRFRGAWQDAASAAPASWAEFALDHGYYNQAHLIADFRAFAGDSPGRLFPPLSDSSKTA